MVRLYQFKSYLKRGFFPGVVPVGLIKKLTGKNPLKIKAPADKNMLVVRNHLFKRDDFEKTW